MRVSAALCVEKVPGGGVNRSKLVLLRLAVKPTVGNNRALACSPFDKLAV